MKRAGHLPLLVEQPEGLGPALKTGHYNVVMTDLAEVATIEAQARAAAVPAPSVLPVLHRPTPEVKASVEAQYSCFVASPGKQVDVLAEIDGLMERKVKDGSAPPPPKKK